MLKIVINFIYKVKEFEDINKKQDNKLKENDNKHLNDDQEHTQLNKMATTIQHLKNEFHKE